MGSMKQLALAIVLGAFAVVIKLHSKVGTQDKMYAQLVQTCDRDQTCVAAVNHHFDACFDDSYAMGVTEASVDEAGFLACFTRESGVEHFALVPDSAADG